MGEDARFIEIEIAEKAANRVMGWAKLFGFFAGIPLLLMTVWLGWLGYTSFQDVRGKLASVQKDVDALEKTRAELETSVTDVETKAGRLQKVITTLETDVARKRLQLAKLNELDAMERQLAMLSTRVKTLEAVRFGGAANVADATKQRIKSTLGRYQERFAALGHHFDAGGEIGVEIEPSAAMKKRGTLAFYDTRARKMVVDETYTAFDDVVLREYAHHMLMAGDARGFNAALRTLESGLADYFSRSFEGAASYPSMPTRTLANDFTIDSANEYDAGLAWGALGWDLRAKVGADADLLLLDGWKLTQRGGGFKPADFGQALLTADQMRHRGANAVVIREILAKRGVTL
jgi:cell division protein FtsB